VWRDEAIVPLDARALRAHACSANALAGETPSTRDWRSACESGAILVRSGWNIRTDDPPAWLPAPRTRWREFALAVSQIAHESGIVPIACPRLGDVLSDMPSTQAFLREADDAWHILLDPSVLLDASMRAHAEDHLARIFDQACATNRVVGVVLGESDPCLPYVVRAWKHSGLPAQAVIRGEPSTELTAMIRTLAI
jgi:hypothetical protein